MKTLPNICRVLLSPKFGKLCYRSALVLYLLILVIGSLPGARHDIGQFASGLVLHSVAYALLGALVFIGGKGAASRRAVVTALTIAVMGAVDECVQSFVPYRGAAVSDWLVDVVAGSVVSALLWQAWPRLSRHAGVD